MKIKNPISAINIIVSPEVKKAWKLIAINEDLLASELLEKLIDLYKANNGFKLIPCVCVK